jgi:hypothetical protein
MEQTPFPGSVGDGCAESSRYVTLCEFLNQNSFPQVNLARLVTLAGVVRYPCPPSPWAASDTSGDQVAPLIAATSLTQPSLADTIISQIVTNKYCTGNGKLINPGLYANVKRHQGSHVQWLWDLSILGQALIFKLPFAWNPNATWNPKSWLISSSGQTSGYLNWTNALAFARCKSWTWPCWLATKIIGKTQVMAAVQSYYRPEPNSAWMLNIYEQAFNKIWD